MTRLYSESVSIPREYIDVKTGIEHPVSPKVQEQIDYHSRNRTLTHLILSALHEYLEPKLSKGSYDEIMQELLEIKKIMNQGISINSFPNTYRTPNPSSPVTSLDPKDIEELLDAFGG
ncbi:hypothetical protein DFP93_10916 [Aneurinibacillus soli]|uniref:Uncharacterized protein n=1 Tax=Aneurinibacillus soli TaxID=1500254 RepID=A0A0U5BI82_9BACL|nr:hypothetical protein [Aneurinibacillus soli]PYE61317.1 hypothetical protein DFP93_10916 [Aneurinibacillus soli]BAU27854.1 hypothetical protein CB4_02028 [Aneurinibacillus soli]